MFEPVPRRHPVQSFQFWFLILVSFGALLGWKLNLFSQSRDGRPKESADAAQATTESLAWVARGRIEDAEAGTTPTALPPQSETPGTPADMNNPGIPKISQNSIASLIAPASAGVPRPVTVSTPPIRPIDGSLLLPSADPMSPVGDAVRPEPEIQLAGREEVVPSSVDAVFQPKGTQVAMADPLPAASSAFPPATEDSTPPPASPTTRTPASSLDFPEFDRLLEHGEEVAAHRLGSILYWQHPESRSQLLGRLKGLAGRIYFDPVTHYLPPRQVEFGDRLETIAREYNVGWEYLAKLNRVDPKKIRPGQELKVIEGPFGAVVDLGARVVTVHAHGYFVAAFACGVRESARTPTGTFQVRNKVANPTYYGPEGTIAADDPQNPLGEYWLEINDAAGTLQGIGIHGTIEPESIGQATSQGCVRLRDAEIAALFDLLTVDSEVVIRP